MRHSGMTLTRVNGKRKKINWKISHYLKRLLFQTLKIGGGGGLDWIVRWTFLWSLHLLFSSLYWFFVFKAQLMSVLFCSCKSGCERFHRFIPSYDRRYLYHINVSIRAPFCSKAKTLSKSLIFLFFHFFHLTSPWVKNCLCCLVCIYHTNPSNQL